MEALESLGIDWRLIIAQVINFLVLLFLLKKFLYGPIINILESRQKKIQDGLENFDHSEQELERAKNEAKKIIAEANEKANKITQETENIAKEKSTKILTDANLRSEKILSQAKDAAESEKDKIYREAKKELASLVSLATEKVVGEAYSEAQVDKAIKDLS